MYLTTWRFQLLGGLSASRADDQVERFQNRKTSGLAACLAFHAGQWLARDWLVENVWPDLPAENGRACLRVSVHSLRRRLEPPGMGAGAVIEATRNEVRFNAAAIATDAARFERLAEAPAVSDAEARLEALFAIYQGPLLPANVESWIPVSRARLEHVFVAQVTAAAESLIAQDRAAFALRQVLEALHRAPDAEELHRLALLLYRMNGRERDAVAHYNGLNSQARYEWGCETPPSLTGAVADLLRGDSDAISVKRTRRRNPTPAEGPAPINRPSAKPAAGGISPLPGSLTRFFGRAEELDFLAGTLSPSIAGEFRRRIITLTGPPGSGKTRLGIEAARAVSSRYGNRVAFVRLGDLRDGERVGEEILKALDACCGPDRGPVDAICEVVGANPFLLVLDNMDPVVEACADLLPRIAAGAPGLTVLATSRAPADVEGEQLVRVCPLPVPQHAGAPNRLMEFASVEMFVDRAQQARPDFHLFPGNAATVTSICSILEGLPLAIELAAARLSSLSAQQVLAELDNRFGFLVSRRRMSESHHSTLETAIGWSCSMLDSATQRLFTRLSVFRGGWTLEAARAVWRDEPDDALDHLESLVRRSLVIADFAEESGTDEDETRYRMLASLREYAEDLHSSEERQAAASMAAEYYLDLAGRWGPALRGARSVEATRALTREIHNIRDAFRVLRESDSGLRLAATIWRLWAGQGLDSEGYSMLSESLQLNAHADPALRCAAHYGAGMLAYFTGKYEAADRHAASALRLAEQSGDSAQRADALNLAGILAGDGGDIERARDLLNESLLLRRADGDAWSIASSLNNLARISHSSGDLPSASALFTEAYGLFNSTGDLANAAAAMMNLATVADAEGDYRSSRVAIERAIELAVMSGRPHDLGFLYYNLGEAMHRDTRHPDASRYLLDSIRIHVEQGNAVNVPYPLATLANVAAAEGDDWRATQLHAASTALRLKLQTPATPDTLKTLHDDIDVVRQRARPEDFDVAWRLGSAMSLEEAVAYARRSSDSLRSSQSLESVPAA